MQLLFRIDPLTHVVEAERALFAGDLSHPSVPIAALAWRWSALQWGRAVCRPAD
jgi:hypothetical protein